MILSYGKYSLKSSIKQFFIKLKLRKHNQIGKSCFISGDCILEGNVMIKDFVYILENVKLGKNSKIGIRALLSNIEIGEDSFVEYGVVCAGSGKGKIIIGKQSYIGINNVLDWSDNIEIGNYVHIAGPSTGIWTHSSANMALHGTKLFDRTTGDRPTSPVIIEDNVYIGGNCTIYPGVKIKHHSVVAPNSVVTKDVESYTMVGGAPAKFIKSIGQ